MKITEAHIETFYDTLVKIIEKKYGIEIKYTLKNKDDEVNVNKKMQKKRI